MLTEPRAAIERCDLADLVHLPPRGSGSPHVARKGREFVAVASGLVQLALANGRPVLRRGEVLLVEATTIERWRNLGPAEATLFWILRD